MRNLIKQLLKEEINSKSERIKSMVNKYGYERTSEMVVGGTDTIRNTYQNNPLEYLNQFNDLKPVENNNKVYYIDKDRLTLFMYYKNEKNGPVFINYDKIWGFFEKVIGLNSSEIKYIMKEWLEETYNIKGLIPKSTWV
jgi:hypothetical protein